MKIPIVLPVVRVCIDGAGALTIDVDGEPYDAEVELGRSDLRSVLDEITSERQTAVRVEVLENDGTTYADIATPPIARAEGASNPPRVPRHSLPGITGRGFQPGEQVAVALVVLHQTADDTGNAVVNLPPSVMSGRRPSVVLFGLESKLTARIEASA